MSGLQQVNNPPKKKFSSCITCFIIMSTCLLLLTCIIFTMPLILDKLGIVGHKAEDVYQLAPDPVASKSLTKAFTDRGIPGVRVYVIPIKGKPTQGAFIILDSSDGYKGLNPINDSDKVFFSILKDLTERNLTENLRISHVTVDYRDEEGKSLLSFTVDQKDVESYANGSISQEEFFKSVHFSLLDTLRRMGIQDFAKETQP